MRKTVLICDDEEGVRESLKLILENDYDLVLAANGDDAIRKTKERPTDIVILDIKMPRRDGVDTLRHIRKINPSAKVIIATGYRSMDVAQEVAKLGAADYIIKPFDRKTVAEIVARHSLGPSSLNAR